MKWEEEKIKENKILSLFYNDCHFRKKGSKRIKCEIGTTYEKEKRV